MTTVDSVVVAVFAAWLLTTLLSQFRHRHFQVVRAADILSLLPKYNFFAPRPIVQDYELEYHDYLPSTSSSTPWRLVPTVVPRRWFHVFWNPTRREKKAFFVAVTQMLRVLVDASSIQQVPLSTPYILILQMVERQPHPGAIATQFRCLEVRGTSRQEIFVSAVHRVNRW